MSFRAQAAQRVRAPGFVAHCTAVAALVLMTACSDRVTGPGAASRMESVSGNAQPGFVGIPLEERLVVRVLDVNGIAVPDHPVTWTVLSGGGSVAPVQTSTDDSGIARTTWTLGLVAGMQEVSANVGGLPPILFSASAAILGDTCSGSPLNLQVGAAVMLVGTQSALVCLQGSTAGVRDFLVVLFNSSRPPNSGTIPFSVVAQGVTGVVGPPLPDVAPLPLPQTAERPQLNHDFDAYLREMERTQLAPRVRGGASAAAAQRADALHVPSYSLASPVVGEILTINAQPHSACDNPRNRDARVMAISQHAVVLADVNNPSGGFTTSEYSSIAQTFDTLVYPVDAEFFGEPEDIDGNNRIVLFYTGEVNRLTPSGGAGGFVAGFFFARDLFPKLGNARLAACAGSNESEILYLMVPDPLGTINGNARDKNFVMNRTTSTMAHEMVHLVNASRRLYVTPGASYPERPWIEEGLAHSAEELLFFHSTGLATGTNVDAAAIQSSSARVEAFNDYQADNVARLRDFLTSSNTNWAHSSSSPSLTSRGASTYFMRYVVDRLGGNQSNTWRAILNSPDTGMRNLENVIHADPVQWIRDWSVALYVDDAVSNLPARHRIPTWHLRSVMASLFPTSGFSLRPVSLNNSVSRTGTLQQGGSVHYRMGVSAGAEGRLQVTPSANSQILSVMVVRTR